MASPQDRALSRFDPVPAGATLAQITIYCTVTTNGKATSYAISGTALAALINAAASPGAPAAPVGGATSSTASTDLSQAGNTSQTVL